MGLQGTAETIKNTFIMPAIAFMAEKPYRIAVSKRQDTIPRMSHF